MTGALDVAVLLSYDQDPIAWRARFAAGETLDETPYGYQRAQGEASLRWARSHAESPLSGRVRRAVAGRLGFDLIHAWRNRALLFGADVVWTHTEREHLAVACLQLLRRRRRRVPVLAQSVWLWDRWTAWGPLRRWFVARLLRTHPIEVVHSRLNLAASRAAVPGRRVELLPFGSAGAPRAESPSAAPLEVLAVGNDVDRDWEVLASAAQAMPDVRIRVASRSRSAVGRTWPENVVCEPAASVDELGGLYAAARVVVVPVRPNLHASGATSCIEAMAVGDVAVIVSTAGGLADYLGPFGASVPAGDAGALVDAVRAGLTGDIAPTPFDAVERRGLTQADYVARYLAVTRWLVGDEDWDPAISDFASFTTRRSRP